MLCPRCKNDSRTVDLRSMLYGIKRIRECLSCKERFTTYETTTFPRKAKAEPRLNKWGPKAVVVGTKNLNHPNSIYNKRARVKRRARKAGVPEVDYLKLYGLLLPGDLKK